MVKTAKKTVPSKQNNEDFIFVEELNDRTIFVVGDFAQTNFVGVDKLSPSLLKASLDINKSYSLPPDLLLTQLITRFNNELLNYRGGSKYSFQCCVLFCLLEGDKIFYISVGDCRLSIKRGEDLFLLNGTIWTDKSDLPLPLVISPDQITQRGYEDPPSSVLGIQPLNFTLSSVKNFSLDKDDIILIYSDGVDKFVSPEQLLKLTVENDSPEKVADAILEEVRLGHGDDDRSIVVAFGPHNTNEDSMEEENRVKLIENQETILEGINKITGTLNVLETSREGFQDKLKQLEDEQPKNQNLNAELSAINESLEKLKKSQTDLQNILSELKELNSSGSLVKEEISDTDNEILKLNEKIVFDNQTNAETLKYIKDTIDKLAEAGNKFPASAESAKQMSDLPPETSADGSGPATTEKSGEILFEDQENTEPINLTSGQTEIEVAQNTNSHDIDSDLLTRNSNIREGVIVVTDKRFELLDEHIAVKYMEKDGKGPIYFIRMKNKPAGWTSMFHLYLRTKWTLKGIEDIKKAENIKEFIIRESETFNFEEVKDFSIEAREEHWKIQDNRKQDSLDKNEYIKLASQEKELALKYFANTDETDKTEIESGGKEDKKKSISDYWSDIRKLSKKHSYWTTFILLSILLAPILAFGIYYFLYNPEKSSNPTSPSNSAQQQSGWGLKISGDGRSLYFYNKKDEKTLESANYRIRIGKEKLFQEALNEIENIKTKDLSSELDDSVKNMIISRTVMEDVPPTNKLIRVEANDVNPSPVSSSATSRETSENYKCENFASRVNKSLQMDILKELNPNLRCKDLIEGDMLLINETGKTGSGKGR